MIVVQNTDGRLGNQLQRLAHIIAFAEEEKTQVVNIYLDEWSLCFAGLKGNLFGRYPATHMPFLPGRRRSRERVSRFLGTNTFKRMVRLAGRRQYNCLACSYESRVYLAESAEIREQNARGVVHLYGHYYYCHKLVRKHARIIRGFFSLLPGAAPQVVEVMESHRGNNPLIVGVHVRRGDYQTFMNGEYFFDDDIYAAAMRKIQELWFPADPLFLLCSDAPLQAKAYSGLRHVVLGTTAIADMFALSLCDLMVGPKSTFSAWASFIGSVPRYIMRGGATQPTCREDFWICDDLRGGLTADDRVD